MKKGLERAAGLKIEQEFLKEELTRKIESLRESATFDPYSLLNFDPQQFNQDCIEETSSVFELCAQIKADMGKGK